MQACRRHHCTMRAYHASCMRPRITALVHGCAVHGHAAFHQAVHTKSCTTSLRAGMVTTHAHPSHPCFQHHRTRGRMPVIRSSMCLMMAVFKNKCTVQFTHHRRSDAGVSIMHCTVVGINAGLSRVHRAGLQCALIHQYWRHFHRAIDLRSINMKHCFCMEQHHGS